MIVVDESTFYPAHERAAVSGGPLRSISFHP